MCLILMAWRVLPDRPLVVAANRDEYHARSASPAHWWEEPPGVLAGRDLQAGGTWMGLARRPGAGLRFAAVTNYRGAREPSAVESRGALVTNFLSGEQPPTAFVQALRPRSAGYSGFNLIATDGETLVWMSNRGGEPRRLEPGIYGLGNTLLDDPEVDEAKRRFARVLEGPLSSEPLFAGLQPSRIVNPQYGTRCSTVLLAGPERVHYSERSFAPDGAQGETRRFEFAP